jgi:hypothetical protein
MLQMPVASIIMPRQVAQVTVELNFWEFSNKATSSTLMFICKFFL